MSCPFCRPDRNRVFHQSEDCLCLWDLYPVAQGHALVVPPRHVANWFEASLEEQSALLRGIEVARKEIEQRYDPSGFNIGINIGEAGGQTVPHLHVHVIPRYEGDVADPRGGVRYVIPEKANYFEPSKDIADSGIFSPDMESQVSVFGNESYPLISTLKEDIAEATQLDIAVAFVTESGLDQIQPYILDMCIRGGMLRFLTGDYMGVTEPRALLRMLDWTQEYPDRTQIRIFQTDRSLGFHPKAYLIQKGYQDVIAYIGSSNVTKHALTAGLEWNQRIEAPRHEKPMIEIREEFQRLFHHPNTLRLDQSWIDGYANRRETTARTVTIAGIDPDVEAPKDIPEPHEFQQEALAALKKTKEEGNKSGLVVMATGLGKTWLAAFDSLNYERVLFVAHREEILKQAQETFRLIRPEASFGQYGGGEHTTSADVLFASIQTLGRQNHLDRFEPECFDYVVVDEFHHAAAKTYRRLIDHFDPQFLLGLTATPERTDGGDLLGLCGENLVYRCDLFEGIDRALLSPFHYYGVPDEVDFSNIPWHSGRFDPQQLEYAVATRKRAENAFQQWREHGLQRTLAFCVSQRHADFMADFFSERGVRVAAVHSGAKSAPRTQSMQQLESGELQIVFAVDMFNEGVNVPTIDTVMMLRPTESRILWLQQLGRGLRKAAEKSFLNVIDYIGNHRTFLQAPMLLLPGASTHGELSRALEALQRGELELPAGCSVEYELEALDILKQLARPTGGAEQILHWYRSFKELHGRRPSASEAWREGYDPKTLRSRYGSWMGFVQSEGDLSTEEQEAFSSNRVFFEAVEVTPMTRSFKMVTLLAMISKRKFPGKIGIAELSQEVTRLSNRISALHDEFGESLKDALAMQRMLEKNPIAAWVGGKGMGGARYFEYQEKIFSSINFSEAHKEALSALTQEICDYRLAQYVNHLHRGEKLPEDSDELPSPKDEGTDGPKLFHEYQRSEIPGLWGFEFNTGAWNKGFIVKGDHIFLLVSLNKKGMPANFKFEDRFLSPDHFQWGSQNGTKRASPTGQKICNHAKDGRLVHLFVRDQNKTPSGSAAPFVYCGDVKFEDWEGDAPITVRWRLMQPVTGVLYERFSSVL